jgi:hypothetical protein
MVAIITKIIDKSISIVPALVVSPINQSIFKIKAIIAIIEVFEIITQILCINPPFISFVDLSEYSK